MTYHWWLSDGLTRRWGALDSTPWNGESMPSVLIIDDDLALSRLVALMLRRSGYVAEVANSGEAGLELLGSKTFDAVVLDLRMPGMDGRTVFREMRSSGIDTPVMILSAYDARRAHDDLGSEAYLNKPFDPEALVAALASMLDSHGPK